LDTHTLFDSDIYVEPRGSVTLELTIHLTATTDDVTTGYVIYDTQTRDWLAAEVPGYLHVDSEGAALTEVLFGALLRAQSFLSTF
jgi:hypothetical protein